MTNCIFSDIFIHSALSSFKGSLFVNFSVKLYFSKLNKHKKPILHQKLNYSKLLDFILYSKCPLFPYPDYLSRAIDIK